MRLAVDDAVVFTGSNNFSGTGTITNEENSVVLRSTTNASRIASFICDIDKMHDIGVAAGQPQKSDADRKDALLALDACNGTDVWFPPTGMTATGDSITFQHVLEAVAGAKRSISIAPDMMANPQLVYAIKMHRREQIADGVDTLQIRMPRSADGSAVVDITADVTPALLLTLRQQGVRILGAYPESHSVRAEAPIDALDTIADLAAVRFVQPMQEAITRQTLDAKDDPPVDPEHLRTTRPGFEERETTLTAELALAIEEFQANAYSVGVAGVRKSEADLTHRAALARGLRAVSGARVVVSGPWPAYAFAEAT